MASSRARVDKGKAKGGADRQGRSPEQHLTPHQYERLLKIIALVAPRYYYPHKDLARDLGVSTRTLQRDIVALRERGVRITQDRGGYRLPSKGGW